MKRYFTYLTLIQLFLSPLMLSAQVFTVPYFDDFESGAPGWVAHADSMSEWQLGLPSFGITNSAYSGNNCWDVDLTNGYQNNSNCILQSPEFNFSGVNSIELSFWRNHHCEDYWDGVVLQYNTDTLQPWSVLGSVGVTGSDNWYNSPILNSNGLPGWSDITQGWIQSSIIIPNFFGTSNVWFRFVFSSDASVVYEGFSIDDFSINASEANSITGTVYLDVNQNNIIDGSDLPFPGIQLTSTNGVTTEVQPSDGNGNYYFISDSASTYSITVSEPLYSVANPANYSITIMGSNQLSSGNDFLITFLPDVLDVGVELYQMAVRPGMNTQTFINYYNQGTTVASGTIELEYDPAFTFLNSSSTANVFAPNTLEFNYSNLLPGQSESIIVEYMVDSTLLLGTVTNINALIYPVSGDTLVTNNYDSALAVAVNSFDPNDKQVFPEGDIAIQSVAAGMDLNYTIRFQNTGTAPAFHVNIYDQLSENADLLTFEVTGSSHPITSWSVNPSRLLHFEFANINLPDSAANEAGSHGYVRYKIRPNTTLTVGQSIDNQAAIYFDNNLPILTNITSSVVVDPTGLSDLIPADQQSLFVFPNPTTGSFNFKSVKGLSYYVLNSLGEQVIEEGINNSDELQFVDMSGFSKGLYLIVVNGPEFLQSAKIIVE